MRITQSKGICRENAFSKFIAVAMAVVMIGGALSRGRDAYGSTLGKSVSAEFEAQSKQIRQIIKDLGYREKISQDFVKMVGGWKDKQGRSIVVGWKNKLAKVKHADKTGEISKTQIARAEEKIVHKLAQKIKREIGHDDKVFELTDVIKYKQAQCIGYLQLFYILGNSIGLSVKCINVVEPKTADPSQEGKGHAACFVGLSNGKTMMVDLVPGGFISMPFRLEEEFTKTAAFWQRKDKDNFFEIDKKIQILDNRGIIAQLDNNRGSLYFDQNQYAKAISCYTKAIELNRRYALAYNNRGIVYARSGQLSEAICDYTKAIELNAKYAGTYYNRGVAHSKLGKYTKAIFDYTKAIEIDPKFTKAYNNRASAFAKLGQYNKTISDCTKAIKLNPKYAGTYKNRGIAQVISGNSKEAKKDLLKTVQLNPVLRRDIKAISNHFNLNLVLD